MRSAEKNKLMTVVVLLGVFLAGVVSGAAALHLMAPDVASARDADEGPGEAAERDHDADRRRGPDGGGFAISRLLHEELELTAEQEARVDSILDRREDRAHELFGQMRSLMRSQFDSTVSDVEAVLTPDQAQRFERLLAQMKERWEKERREGRDGGDRTPGPSGAEGG